MLGQPRRYSLWLTLGLALLLTVPLGCSTPRERYKVLSFFFDGVPNPDAPPKKIVAAVVDTEDKPVLNATVISRHKPYEERKCAVCHSSAKGEIQEFGKAYEACVKCHKKVTTGRPRMHGPVAVGACSFCHAPHESIYPALLKDSPAKVCRNCHEQALLSAIPQHAEGQKNCITCHYGHGGNERYFLKPEPTSAPATVPATLPATPPVPSFQLPQGSDAATPGGPA